MSPFDAFRYDGKRALVVGGATGMGAAVATLGKDAGADVLVADRAPVTLDGVESFTLDLSDEGSIRAFAEAVDGPIHALFSCAGVADGTPGIEKINFLGHRLLIDLLLEAGKLPRGSAIGMISSAAGMGWRTNLEKVQTYLGIADFEEASTWAKDNAKADYMWSKMAINAYVAGECMNLLKEGVRINAILPGPTDTPMMPSFVEMMGEDFFARFPKPVGRNSTPEEQAWAIVMLNSPRSSYVAATNVFTDGGFSGGIYTDSIDFAAILGG